MSNKNHGFTIIEIIIGIAILLIVGGIIWYGTHNKSSADVATVKNKTIVVQPGESVPIRWGSNPKNFRIACSKSGGAYTAIALINSNYTKDSAIRNNKKSTDLLNVKRSANNIPMYEKNLNPGETNLIENSEAKNNEFIIKYSSNTICESSYNNFTSLTVENTGTQPIFVYSAIS